MPTSPSATEIAEAAGFDLSLIRENLSLTYEQRALQHQAALDLMLEMERAGQRLRDTAQSSDPATQRR
jgi:lipopolysaccharide biosynthesis protein